MRLNIPNYRILSLAINAISSRIHHKSQLHVTDVTVCNESHPREIRYAFYAQLRHWLHYNIYIYKGFRVIIIIIIYIV